MKPEILLADISRKYFKMKKIYKYRTKKVAEMSDSEIIRACHWYYEENNLVDEFWDFREEIESQYRYCFYLQEYIEEGVCCDIQMIANGTIRKEALSEQSVDKEIAMRYCRLCRYSF